MGFTVCGGMLRKRAGFKSWILRILLVLPLFIWTYSTLMYTSPSTPGLQLQSHDNDKSPYIQQKQLNGENSAASEIEKEQQVLRQEQREAEDLISVKLVEEIENGDISKLAELIRNKDSNEDVDSGADDDAEDAETKSETKQTSPTTPTKNKDRFMEFYKPKCPPHPIIETAKNPYGTFPDGIRAKAAVICETAAGSADDREASIKFYPGNVLEFRNVLVDFRKRHISSWSELETGFVTTRCELTTESDRDKLMHEFIGKSAQTGQQDATADKADTIFEDPVLFISRDDCGNTWHSLADYLKMFNAGLIAETSPQDRYAMVIDERVQISDNPDDAHTQCPYNGAMQALGRKGLLRGVDYADKQVFFRHLIVPADVNQFLGMIWAMGSCDMSQMLGLYVNNVFDYFGLGPLNEILMDPIRDTEQIVHITFSSRRKKPFAPNAPIGRRISNEKYLTDALGVIPGVRITVVEFFELTYKEQVTLMRNTDCLIGMHGAGMTNLIYEALDGIVFELVPFTWRSNEYHDLSQMTGRKYLYWQNPDKSKHHEDYPCDGFEARKSADEPNICRTGTSATEVDIETVVGMAKKAIRDLRVRRGWTKFLDEDP